MARYQSQRIVPIILVVIIIIIAVAALVSLARAVFFSGSNGSNSGLIDISRDALLSTDVDREVTMTVRGPIVADEQFNSYSISVTPSSRVITVYTGYLDAVLNRQTYSNNTTAYDEFVHALDKAKMADGTQLEGEANDTRGVCATGHVYEYGIIYDDDLVKGLWTSTCGGSKGSLKASSDQLQQLFLAQIPDSDEILKEVDL